MIPYYLASTAEYRTIANLFEYLGHSFVIASKMCVVPLSRICRRFIYIPTNDELESLLESYKEKWGFPMCAGAMDGTHIPIMAPKENQIDYVNRKGYHSVVMQAVVDCNYLFRDTVIGWPGSLHDARILSNSKLYKKGNDKRLFPDSRER